MNAKLLLEFLLLNLALKSSFACFRTGPSWFRQRTVKSRVLLMNEKVPNIREDDAEASGGIGDFVWEADKSKYLVRVDDTERFAFKSESARWMTQDCRNSLLTLGDAVSRYWPHKSVIILVLRAWESPPSIYSSNNTLGPNGRVRGRFLTNNQLNGQLRDHYHYSGQAVNILLTRRRNMAKEKNMTLGVLGQLAYFEAHFTSCFYSENHFIHCSVKKRSAEFGCFTSESKVQVKDRGIIEMKNVKRGDLVRSVSSEGKVVYSPVILFLHREISQLSEFISIQVDSGQSLSLTKNHLIYRVPSYNDDFWNNKRAVFAGTIKPGDLIIVKDTQNVLRLKRVVSVSKGFVKKGVYSPLTAEGRIIVDDIVASTYSQIADENLARMAFQPYIAYQSMVQYIFSLIRSKQEETWDSGIHWYAKFLWTLGSYFVPSYLMYTR